MINNSSKINKPKESLNSDGQQFLQYQQTKIKFEQWWSTIPLISTKQKNVWTVMVNNSSNINKPKESLNSDGQQFLQYQQTKRKFEQWLSTILLISTNQKKVWTVMVNNSSNINKSKESLNSDGQQFYQYQQTKRKFKQWWSTILPISTKQTKVLTVMVDNSSNINKPKESFNSDDQQFIQYQQTKRKFEQWWSTIPPISTNQNKVWTVMVNNSFNINKTKECLNSDGRQFHQYQQTKWKFKQWWSTIPPISTNQKKVWKVMVKNSSNINKPKESLNSDGQQFLQYQQTKRKF